MKHFIYLGDLEKCNGTFTEPVCVKEVKDIGALSFRSEKTVKRYCAEKDNSLIILPDGECAEKSYILDEKVNKYTANISVLANSNFTPLHKYY